MKGMIKGNTETAAKQMNSNYAKLLNQFPFVVQKKPKAPGAGNSGSGAASGADANDDFTTEKALKAILQKEKTRDDFTVAQEMLVGLSAT